MIQHCQTSIKNCLILFILFFYFSNLYAQTQTFTTSGNFMVPAGVSQIKVEAWGAGGGGGSITSNNITGGGGGGGAYASSLVTVISGNSYSLSVGVGGLANSNGANTFFNTNVVLAAGGRGALVNSITRGSGGLATNSIGNVRFSGGNGSNGNVTVSFSGGGGGRSR